VSKQSRPFKIWNLSTSTLFTISRKLKVNCFPNCYLFLRLKNNILIIDFRKTISHLFPISFNICFKLFALWNLPPEDHNVVEVKFILTHEMNYAIWILYILSIFMHAYASKQINKYDRLKKISFCPVVCSLYEWIITQQQSSSILKCKLV